MIVQFHKNFEKRYKKLRPTEQKQFKNKLKIFMEDCFHPSLNNHALQGKYYGYRSINVTGDLRAIYKFLAQEKVIFVAIDSHSNLYK